MIVVVIGNIIIMVLIYNYFFIIIFIIIIIIIVAVVHIFLLFIIVDSSFMKNYCLYLKNHVACMSHSYLKFFDAQALLMAMTIHSGLLYQLKSSPFAYELIFKINCFN